jgi:hypothetical protein
MSTVKPAARIAAGTHRIPSGRKATYAVLVPDSKSSVRDTAATVTSFITPFRGGIGAGDLFFCTGSNSKGNDRYIAV